MARHASHAIAIAVGSRPIVAATSAAPVASAARGSSTSHSAKAATPYATAVHDQVRRSSTYVARSHHRTPSTAMTRSGYATSKLPAEAAPVTIAVASRTRKGSRWAVVASGVAARAAAASDLARAATAVITEPSPAASPTVKNDER